MLHIILICLRDHLLQTSLYLQWEFVPEDAFNLQIQAQIHQHHGFGLSMVDGQ